MKHTAIAATVIMANFVVLSLPLIGLATLWRYVGHNEPMFASYLVVLAPVSWLIWGICKQRQLHLTDSTVLRAFSWLNTALVFVFLLCFVLWLNRSCQHFTTILN